jgi:hypothetical protein
LVRALVEVVWEVLLERKIISQQQYKHFADLLDFIENYPVSYLDDVEPMAIEDAILDKNDPRFEELRQKWIGLLAPIKDDPIVGPVVTRFLP